MAEPVIIILEPFGGSSRRHNAALPFVFWDDAAVTRGDGVFESLLVRNSRAANLERHIARFCASAALLELPEPRVDNWRRATQEAIEAWNEKYGEDVDAKCVWTYTRGRASTGFPSAWITLQPVGEQVLRQRKKGVAVMTTPRGYTIDTELPGVSEATEGTTGRIPTPVAPWLTVGAKTLNYAANMAALRHARAQGFDDVLYTDGERVLEGATSTVVIVKKGNRLRTPAPGGDVLPGTTQAALFAAAKEQGWKCKAKEITVADLHSASSVWLVSSVRLAVRVTKVDDTKLSAPSDKEVKAVRGLIDAALGI